MNFYFFILLIIILIVIYICWGDCEKFTTGYEPDYFNYEQVNYNTKKQNCDELTYTPEECMVETVIPKNKIVCNESLTPITNNNLINKIDKKKKNPTLSLKYDFDLLSSFNNSQIDGDENNNLKINNLNELESFEDLKTSDDLKTDVKSFDSLENDLITNY